MFFSLVMLHVCKLTVRCGRSRIDGEEKRGTANRAGQVLFCFVFFNSANKTLTKIQLSRYTGKI